MTPTECAILMGLEIFLFLYTNKILSSLRRQERIKKYKKWKKQINTIKKELKKERIEL